jgi:WD40 repeat protein
MWDGRSHEERARWQVDGAVSIHFRPGSHSLAVVGLGGVTIRDLDTGVDDNILTTPASSIAFSADGRIALTGGSIDGSLLLWDVDSGARASELPGLPSPIEDVALSGDGHRVAARTGLGVVAVWDVATGSATVLRRRGVPECPWARHACSQPGRRHFHRCSQGAGRRRARPAVHRLSDNSSTTLPRHHGGNVRNMEFTGASTMVSAADDGSAVEWDPETGDAKEVTRGPMSQLTAIAVSADGRNILSGSSDGRMVHWDRTDSLPDMLPSTGFGKQIAVDATGRRLVTAQSGGEIAVLDLADSSRRVFRPGIEFYALTFSPDGSRLAVGGRAERSWSTTRTRSRRCSDSRRETWRL